MNGTTTLTGNSGLRFENSLGGSEYDLLKLAMPHYDELEAKVGEAVARHFKRDARSVIETLEIGPGSGITTKVLLDCDPRVKITAVDNSKKMQEAFKAKIAEWAAESRAKLEEAEIMAHLETVPDCSFDLVATGFVIHNIEFRRRKKLIKEIYRVLRPGGLFVNADKLSRNDPALRADVYVEQIRRFDTFDAIERPEIKAEWIEHYKVDEQPHIVYTEAAAEADMADAGFVNVSLTYREMMEAVIVGTKN